jgi:hypothetical protein
LQWRRTIVGETLRVGNCDEPLSLVTGMDREGSEVLKCDFDLVMKAEEHIGSSSQRTSRGAAVVRLRPGIVAVVQEQGLAEVVGHERSASGVAISIKDCWRCN